MRAVVVYESMYGNTHLVANAIGAGLETAFEVSVVPVSRADPAVLGGAVLVVVGGPTHVHGMSRASTRKAAAEAADKPVSPLNLEPDAAGPGLREWFASLGPYLVKAAAFDTRMHAPAVLTGRALNGGAGRGSFRWPRLIWSCAVAWAGPLISRRCSARHRGGGGDRLDHGPPGGA